MATAFCRRAWISCARWTAFPAPACSTARGGRRSPTGSPGGAAPSTGWSSPVRPTRSFREFATASARAYFTAKKEQGFGPFAELLGRTGVLTEQIGRALAELTTILPDPEGAGIDDILLFPLLRSLSIVPGLPLPPEVAHYRERLSVRSAVPLVDALRRAR